MNTGRAVTGQHARPILVEQEAEGLNVDLLGAHKGAQHVPHAMDQLLAIRVLAFAFGDSLLDANRDLTLASFGLQGLQPDAVAVGLQQIVAALEATRQDIAAAIVRRWIKKQGIGS